MIITLALFVEDFSEVDEPMDDPAFVEEHKKWVDEVLSEPMTFEVGCSSMVVSRRWVSLSSPEVC